MCYPDITYQYWRWWASLCNQKKTQYRSVRKYCWFQLLWWYEVKSSLRTKWRNVSLISRKYTLLQTNDRSATTKKKLTLYFYKLSCEKNGPAKPHWGLGSSDWRVLLFFIFCMCVFWEILVYIIHCPQSEWLHERKP